MPGHKGRGVLCEELDITEISGADSLYDANGIIRESEDNASSLFGCRTFYSTEGSSHTIRAMLALLSVHAKETGHKPLVLATRNAHRAFLGALALLDIEVDWLTPKEQSSYLSLDVSSSELDGILSLYEDKPTALYITSPDYLGGVADVRSLADVCHKHGVLLLVDNAHGAYLHFLSESRHPISLGADLCCDSAHKTLSALTPAAYLHVSDNAPSVFSERAKDMLALFGTSSPSYLILQSLDSANVYLNGEYREELASFITKTDSLRAKLEKHGYLLYGDEPLKLTISTKPYGYRGNDFAELLRSWSIECEFCDPDFTVLMMTPKLCDCDMQRLADALLSIKKRTPISETPPTFLLPRRIISPREAILSPCERISAREAKGRILAQSTVGCPPAVPIIMSGELIDENTVRCFEYYGINSCLAVK